MPLKSLHHVIFEVPDLEATRRFAEDFGLEVVTQDNDCLYMRTGSGDSWCYMARLGEKAKFIAMGFMVDGKSDLEAAVTQHGATPIIELDSPGGGLGVTLKGPEDFHVNLITGVQEASHREPAPHLRINAPGAVTRFATPQPVRPLGPAKLFRLGHLGLYVKDYELVSSWFQDVLGLRFSDTLHPGNPAVTIGAFMRIPRGEEWVDHHAVGVFRAGKSDLHHISFEVQDYEAQFRTHRWLQKQGWDLSWGVGRHALGSHVFDTWFDPNRYRFETFSDTDVVNDEHQTGHHDMHESDLDVWSSDPPDRYFN